MTTGITTLLTTGALVFGSLSGNGYDKYASRILTRQLTEVRSGAGLFINEHLNDNAQSASENALLPHNEMLRNLRDGGLPISAISTAARVERKTIYSWLGGGDIRPENLERLEQVYTLLSQNKSATYRSIYRLWKKKVDGYSLADLLEADEINAQQVSAVLDILWLIARKYDAMPQNNTQKYGSENPAIEDLEEVFVS